ncbi:MAG: addiction module protein [Planctomycetota bacterium]
MDISIEDIRKLPASEQLELAEQIWDSLLASGQLLQQWQCDEAELRRDQLEDDSSIALTHEQMWRAVKKLRDQ